MQHTRQASIEMRATVLQEALPTSSKAVRLRTAVREVECDAGPILLHTYAVAAQGLSGSA